MPDNPGSTPGPDFTGPEYWDQPSDAQPYGDQPPDGFASPESTPQELGFTPGPATAAPGAPGYPSPAAPSYPGAGSASYPGTGSSSYPGAGSPSYPGAGAPSYPGAYPGAASPSYPSAGFPSYPGAGSPSYPGAPYTTPAQPWSPAPETGPGLPVVENVGRGMLFAVLGILAGLVLTIALWQVGFIASITTFVMALVCVWLYARGAGTPPSKGIPFLITMIVIGVLLCAIGVIASDAMRALLEEYPKAPLDVVLPASIRIALDPGRLG